MDVLREITQRVFGANGRGCDHQSAPRAISPALLVLLQVRNFLLLAYINGIAFVSTRHCNIQRKIDQTIVLTNRRMGG